MTGSSPPRTTCFKLSTNQWGWVHLILGCRDPARRDSGCSRARLWARTVGVIMAVISGLSAFAYIPIYPVWGIMIGAVAIAVIWALTAHGRDVADL